MNTYEQIAVLKGKQSDINGDIAEKERIDAAKYILKRLPLAEDTYNMTWLVKAAGLAIDLDFVKEGLIEIYRTSKNEKLKSLIMDLHNGELDLEGVREECREWQKLDYDDSAWEESLRQEALKDLGLTEEDLIGYDNRSFNSRNLA